MVQQNCNTLLDQGPVSWPEVAALRMIVRIRVILSDCASGINYFQPSAI